MMILKRLTRSSHRTPTTFTRILFYSTQACIEFPELFSHKSQHVASPSKPKTSVLLQAKSLSLSAVKERIAFIEACLTSNQVHKAEILFNRTLKKQSIDLKSLIHTDLINAFIQCHCTQKVGKEPNIQRALDWFNRLPELGLQPNLSTFANLIGCFLSVGMVENAAEFIDKMQAFDLRISDLYDHAMFKEGEEKNLLDAFLSSSKYKNLKESQDSIDPLLESVIQEQLITPSINNQSLHASATELKDAMELKTTDAIGVTILKKILADMRKIHPQSKYDQQIWLEERSQSAAQEEFEQQFKRLPENIKNVAHLPSDLVWNWYKDFVGSLTDCIAKIEKENTKDMQPIIPFLRILPIDVLCRITISEILRSNQETSRQGLETMGCRKLTALMTQIGRAIEKEYNLQQFKKHKNLKLIKNNYAIHQLHSGGKLFNLAVRDIAMKLEKENQKLVKWMPIWPDTTKAKLGSILLHEFMKIAKVSVEYEDFNGKRTLQEPAFTHVLKRIEGTCHKIGMVQYHPALYDLILKQPVRVQPWLLPMIVPPRPWITWTSGGYFQHRNDFVRIHNNPEHKEYLIAADEAHHLNLVLRSLDVLGMTPWVINKKVFHVATEIWNQGKGGPSIPSVLDLPPIKTPDQLDQDPLVKRKYKLDVEKREIELLNNFSQRCDVNYKIEVAKAFLDETIYFPHNVDFRGRAYPMPPHLNHLGNDLCRGLLLFAKVKPLGLNGLKWLKIQISNLMGHDKIPFEERIAFTEAHLQDIFDSADAPLDGKRWWMSAEDAWQCLAACIELTNALRSPEPLLYESGLPIHQDGTCNGLQHYAALGGDLEGAAQVNMTIMDKPQDIYTGVAKKVEELIKLDALENKEEALLMQDRVTRKLVKQTVMTNTYGVTYVGARKQVWNRLKEARASDLNPLTDEEIAKCAKYTTHKIFDAMKAMFEGARNIQLWLNKTAATIARSVAVEDIPQDEIELSDALLKLGLASNVDAMQVKEMKTETSLIDSVMQDMKEELNEIENQNLDSFDLDEEFPELLKKPHVILSKKSVPQKMTSMTWTTPLGLPVVQPYRNWKSQLVNTPMQPVSVNDYTIPSPVNPQKQSTAFPPNFIHSLDASHMMLSALACQKQGLTFASVHDSYWTHACDVDTMNSILRDAFIKLHSEDIMNRLRNELIDRYGSQRIQIQIQLTNQQQLDLVNEFQSKRGKKPSKTRKNVKIWIPLKLDELPKRGSFDIQCIRQAKYFFH